METTEQNLSKTYIRMASDTSRLKRPDHTNGTGTRTGVCGDTVQFFLQGDKNRIDAVYFVIKGCVNTLACCNTVAHFVTGELVQDAWDITPEQIIEFLETLDDGHHHCAELAAGAFYLALADLSATKPCYLQR